MNAKEMKEMCKGCGDNNCGWCNKLKTNNVEDKISKCPNIKRETIKPIVMLTQEEELAVLILEKRFDVTLINKVIVKDVQDIVKDDVDYKF